MNELTHGATLSSSRRPYSPLREDAAIVGTSFKPEHLTAILEAGLERGFFEVHAENYMGAGGPPHRALEAIRQHYPISVHGVCMSIGGQDPINCEHLKRFRTVVERYEPMLVSEHLAWSSHGGAFLNDLLPLPYTDETLNRVCEHIDQVQEAIGRVILLENPATYVRFASSTMSEADFICTVAGRTGCGLLLDINNVHVSATNHGYSTAAYLDSFPLEYVQEIHLAGHVEQRDDEGATLLIDSHNRSVASPVWELYQRVIAQIGQTPTLIEWDSDLPSWPKLKAEAQIALHMMTTCVPHSGCR